MLFSSIIRKGVILVSWIFSTHISAQEVSFNIGTSQWAGSFPGSGVYNNSISGIQVIGSADRIIDQNVDVTAVFSGNDNPVVERNYSYTFPPGSTVSIDFLHLTVNSSNLPEAIGNFSAAPSQAVLGNGHNLVGLDLELEGSQVATVATVSTLTWVNVSSLSFDVASNGNVAFIGHRNLRVSGSINAPLAVSVLSNFGMIILCVAIFWLTIRRRRRSHV